MSSARQALRLQKLTPEQRRKLADFVKSGNRTIEDFFKELDKEKRAEKRKETVIEVVETLVSTIEDDLTMGKSVKQLLVESKGRELREIWEKLKKREIELSAWARRINFVSENLKWARRINDIIVEQINLKNFETERFVICFQKSGSRWKTVFVRCPQKKKDIDFDELFPEEA